MTAAPDSVDSGNLIRYPMQVVSVSDFLKMTKLEPHGSLKRKGIVTEYCEEMVVMFVSHRRLVLSNARS